jgi:hypothetical protein
MKKMPDNQIAFYQSPDGSVNIEVLFAEENIWLTQKKMAELFDCSADNISLHLKNIYQENEVDQKSTTEEFSVVQKEGERKVARIDNMYLDYAEMQAARGRAMTMQAWAEKLNAFLKFSEYEILTDAGKISHEVAEALALGEFEKYRRVQDRDYISDFDREVKKLEKGMKLL